MQHDALTITNVAAYSPISYIGPGSMSMLDHIPEVINKTGPILGIGSGSIYIIGPGPICHMGLAYNRQVCLPSTPIPFLDNVQLSFRRGDPPLPT